MPEWLIWLGYSGYGALMIVNAYIFYRIGKVRIGPYATRLTTVEKEQTELIKVWGPRMSNAELRRDQAYDAISAMLFLQYKHWPLTLAETEKHIPRSMWETLTRVETWKREHGRT